MEKCNMKNQKAHNQLRGKPIATFYSSFIPSLILVTISFIAIVIVLIYFLMANNTFSEFKFSLLYTFGIAVMFTVILIRVFPVRIYETGIQAYSYTEFNQRMSWDDIYRVDANFLYVHLRDKEDKICITIPNKWLVNYDEFKRLIQQHAGEHHPLFEYFITTKKP